MKALAISAEFFPMNERDLDSVSKLEASLQAFPWSRGNFADSLLAGHSAWVLKLGGNLIGFSVSMLIVDEIHLLNIGIDKAFQGQGYGARLLRHTMNCASESGASKMFLEVRPSNDKAIELYQHFGFCQIGVRKAYYPSFAGREDALVFEKELN